MNKKKIKLGFRVHKYIIWPIISCLILFLLSIGAMQVDLTLGIIGLIASIFNIIVFLIMYILARKRLIAETLDLSLQVSDIQKDHLVHFDIPHCILDGTGRISWYNDMFYDLVEDPKLTDKNIHNFFTSINSDQFPSYEKPLEVISEFKEKVYRIVIQKHVLDTQRSAFVKDMEDFFYYSAYFYDITEEVALKRINKEQKAIIGYVYVDNYEEILQSIEDVRRPILVALIDRNLNHLAKEVEGVLRKVEKDKYVLFFQRKYLERLKDEKFSILDDIRNINIGNELPVTISIGLGVHDNDYVSALDYARIAIDLALGRGGDQAVIKNNDKFSFYGGKTRGVETNTRVKARIKAYAFKELLAEADNVIVMGHHLQDLDSLGAAIGVFACARLLEKKVNIVLDDITTAINALYERVQESPSFPEDIFVSGAKAIELCDENTVLVVVDVNRPSYTECPELLNYARKVVVFDHHRASSEYIEPSVLSYIEPYASSTCEMVTEILRYITDKVKLDPVEADALFAGISVDTKNFVIKTGVKTFEAAAFLRRNGADVIRVRKFFKNDMATYKARASAVRDAVIYQGKIAISESPSDVSNATLVAAQAADELLNISGIKASFVMTNLNGTIYISARSFDDINVQLIMEKLGGGGHLSVAGAQLQGQTIQEAIDILKHTIDEYLEEGEEE